jgi:hypothetical protein
MSANQTGRTPADDVRDHLLSKLPATRWGDDSDAPGDGLGSWEPVDVAEVLAALASGAVVGPQPTMLLRVDGAALLYPGEMHQIAAEPESGKSWIALSECARLIAEGKRVLYVDFEDGAAAILGRLLALGADDAAIGERFTYVRPDERMPAAALAQILERGPFAFAVLDGMTEAYTMLGLSGGDNDDVAEFLHALPRQIARSGAAVLLIDHVVKDKESRGRFPIGGQHKLAGVTASYSVQTITQPNRSQAGMLKIRVEKDRPGHVREREGSGKVIALARIEPSDGGRTVVVRLDMPDDSVGDETGWRPTVLMERVSLVLEGTPGMSKRAIRDAVVGKATNVDRALGHLIEDGYVRVEEQGQTTRHHVVRAYVKPSDNEDRVPVSPPCPAVSQDTLGNRVPVSRSLDRDTGHAPREGVEGDRVPSDRVPAAEASFEGLSDAEWGAA